MITLKEWNAFPQRKREKACKFIFGNEYPEFEIQELSKEWHHKIDPEHKVILSSLYKRDSNGKPYYICKTEIVLWYLI